MNERFLANAKMNVRGAFKRMNLPMLAGAKRWEEIVEIII